MCSCHELSHLQRRDNLRKWLLHWVTILWPPALRKQIREDLHDYNERVCDLAAAPAHNSLDTINTVIQTVEDYCQSSAQNNSHHRQQRIADLNRELAFNNRSGKNAFFHHCKFIVSFSSLWLTLVLATLYFGHPLIEWLSR